MTTALLPEEFHAHWFSNALLSVQYPLSVEKIMTQSFDRPQIIVLFKCQLYIRGNIKHGRVVRELIYNHITQNYEFNGTRFLTYAEALFAMKHALNKGIFL